MSPDKLGGIISSFADSQLTLNYGIQKFLSVLGVSLCTICVPGAHEGQKRALDAWS